MSRPAAPPGMKFFGPERPEAGPHALEMEFGGLRLALEGLSLPLVDRLVSRYSPYARLGPGSQGALRVRLGLEDRDYFIAPPGTPENNPVLLAVEGERVRYLGYRVAGWLDLRETRGQILLSRGGYEPEERAIENYARVAVAWMAASRGGGLIHAASAVWRGKGYLFYGPSGAGKSTLCACNTRARIVSDDLSIVLPDEEGRAGLDLVGSPFRGTYTAGEPVRGRFPLAAALRLVKAERTEVERVPRPRAFAGLVANLPFVAETFPRRPDLFQRLERAFENVPLAWLRFRKDDSYWDALERAGL